MSKSKRTHRSDRSERKNALSGDAPVRVPTDFPDEHTPREYSAAGRAIGLKKADPGPLGKAQLGAGELADRMIAACQTILSASDPFPAIKSEALAKLTQWITSHEARPPATLTLPNAAPELWSERDLNRRENAMLFLRRVYGPWIGKGLSRRDVRALDKDLYNAVHVWLHRHPEDEPHDLPAGNEHIDQVVAELKERLAPDDLRRVGYAIHARTRK